ncbi:MAG: beta-lactamase family protein [Acidaminococcaceae bacterium]|nr:beta-lactamase family protein [Acidaminococcaceae bacterium]
MGTLNLEKFISLIELKKIDLYGISVVQHGKLAGEFYRKNKLRKEIRSCSKSITSLAVGRAFEEGLFNLDDKIADYFEPYFPKNPQPELFEIRIRNLLTMTMGYNRYILSPFIREQYKGDWLYYIFSEKIDIKPGTRFVYNNACPYLCGVLIARQSGQSYLDWMKERFFTPLGINNPQWFCCPMGRPLALGGLFLTLEELSRFGQLCLNGGVWEGRRLVSRGYLQAATSRQISVDTGIDNVEEKPVKDFASGYGYFFWINEKSGYRMWGRYGQNCIILPEYDAVITIQALEEKNEQGLLDCVWEGILPQL